MRASEGPDGCVWVGQGGEGKEAPAPFFCGQLMAGKRKDISNDGVQQKLSQQGKSTVRA